MEYSWNRKRRYILRFSDIFIILYAIALISGGIALFILSDIVLMCVLGIFSIVLAMILFRTSLKDNLIVWLKYSVDTSGIMVEYPNHRGTTYFYRWEEISEISVCDVHHAKVSGGDLFDFVIRIVVGDEPDGPRNEKCSKNIFGYEKWRRETYEWKHWKQIIVIEYSPERYNEIKKASGMEIKDYRRPYSDAWKIKVPN